MVFCEVFECIIGFDYTNSVRLVNCFLLAFILVLLKVNS
ncbi:hypothetical protein LEP1GSC125_1920 [Leptospira mayottensis 200901122]|uniref:Uncharacterized protein n=1 Tax=Leptospira mayottensis 200901122 TaxID=1193010 RepID=A0AA87SV46_9LEPT|nr:hypothetical protein LEP1GSC125_1920 [Leptospira mayottensis 200901122]